MLFESSDIAPRQLQSLAQADTLIHKELSAFNIQDRQLQETTIKVDSNFSRKIYHIGVPFQFSKTQLHAELNKIFYKYDVKTPARVSFPEKNMRIELVYHNTVIRTVSIQTDHDLVADRNNVSILIVFNEVPDDELLSQLESLGEPIPIVLTIDSPMQANELNKQLKSKYRHLIFWLQDENGNDLIKTNPKEAINKLRQLEDVMPSANMLLMNNRNSGKEPKLVARTNISFVNASNALMLHEDLGKASFREELDQLANDPSHSMALVTGNETTVSWLSNKIPELKKTGVDIIYPPKMHF
ncbi:MAG TPA: hypothetical protein VJ964_01485 [Balneolaceae bacterium]|nr:hypothetical protein [Balneolaceae bacterium]